MNFRKTFAVLSCAALVAASANTVSLTAFAAENVYAKTTAYLNLRSGTGTNYNVITVIDENAKVTVIDRSNPNWLKVRLADGTTGYCSADYLDIITDGYATTAVNIRTGPSTNYNIIETIQKNTKIDIIRYAGSSWAYVRLPDGTVGYMCTDYVTYTAPASTQTSAAAALEMKLSVSSRRIAVGTTYTLKTSNNQGTVTWKSSDTKVAKVDANGKVTAVAAGSAVITATDSKTKKTAQCTITVVKTEFTKITLSETSKTLMMGESFTLKATADNNSKNIRFKSSNTNVAKVDSNGKVTSVGTGSANITASDSTGVVTAVCKVTVKSKDSISLSNSSVSVNVGSSVVVTATKSDSSMKLKWSSSNEKVASVNNGRISGLSAGSAVITVSDSTGKVTAKCNVKVNAVSRGNVWISYSSYPLPAGKTVRITGSNGSSWGTSDSSIATVKDGFITARNPGKAAITFSDRNGNKAVCIVTVTAAEPVKFSYASPNVATLNSTVTLTAVTDKSVSDLYFNVAMDNKILKVKATSKVVEGNTYVWKGAFKASQYGNFKATAYACKNGKWLTCNDGVCDVHILSGSRSESSYDERYASDEIIVFIRDKEGYLSTIQEDQFAADHPTIGHGIVIWNGDTFYDNLTRTEAYAFLVKKINSGEHTRAVNNFLGNNGIKYNQHQFDALVSFTYNFGPGVLNDTGIKNTLLNCRGTERISGNTAVVKADGGLCLRESASTSSNIITTMSNGEKVTILDKSNSSWYKVKTSSGKTGYCSSEYLSYQSGSQNVKDLAFVNKNDLIDNFLIYHHAGGQCLWGLLYRRIDEVEMFLYGDYVCDGRNNKYGFAYPSCIE